MRRGLASVTRLTTARPNFAAGVTALLLLHQLALAIADLALQTPHWSTPAEDLIKLLSTDVHHITALLEILRVLPEEIGNPLLSLTQKNRQDIAHALGNGSPSMFPFLQQCLMTEALHTPQLLKALFRCLSAWFTFGGQCAVGVEATPLLRLCFEATLLPDQDIRDAAVDACICAIRLGNDRNHHQELHDESTLLALQLRDSFDTAVASFDEARAHHLTEVLVEAAEALIDVKFVAGQANDKQMAALSCMSAVAQYGEVEVVPLSFQFWFRLGDLIFDVQRPLSDMGTPESQKNAEDIKAQFRPHFAQLFNFLLQSVKCEPEIPSILNKDDDLQDFRSRVADLVTETTFILGAEATLAQFWTACQQGVEWSSIEAALFMMTCRLGSKIQPQSEVAPLVLNALASVDTDQHPQLQYTAIILLGDLSTFAKNQPAAVLSIWNLLKVRLRGKSQFLSVAVKSVCKLCRVTRHAFAPHMPELIDFLSRADALEVDDRNIKDLLRGCGEVIAHLVNVRAILHGDPDAIAAQDMMKALFEALLGPVDERLKADVAAGRSPLTALDRFGEIFKYTNIPLAEQLDTHPLFDTSALIFETLKSVLTHFAADKHIVEEANRSLKHIFRMLDHHALPLAQTVLELTIELYTAHTHPSCLYVTTGVIKAVGSKPELSDTITAVLAALSKPTFDLLGGSSDAIVHNPFVVDDFFRLMIITLKTFPALAYDEAFGMPAFQLGLAATLLNHRIAHETVCEFLRLFVGLHRTYHIGDDNRASVKEVILRYLAVGGQALVANLVHGLAGDLPSMYVVDNAEVLFEIHLIAPTECAAWVHAVLTSDRLTQSRATPEQLREFLEGFQLNADGSIKEHQRKKDYFLKDLIKPFSRIFGRFDMSAQKSY